MNIQKDSLDSVEIKPSSKSNKNLLNSNPLNNSYNPYKNQQYNDSVFNSLPISLIDVQIRESDNTKLILDFSGNPIPYVDKIGEILKSLSDLPKILNGEKENEIILKYENHLSSLFVYNCIKNEINLISLIDMNDAEDSKEEEEKNSEKKNEGETTMSDLNNFNYNFNCCCNYNNLNNLNFCNCNGLNNANFDQNLTPNLNMNQSAIQNQNISPNLCQNQNQNLEDIINRNQYKEYFPLKNRFSQYKNFNFKTNSFRDYSMKYVSQYIVQIENESNFQVTKMIIGNNGILLRKIIIDNCIRFKDYSTKIRLRGKGSGYKEGPNNEESNDPLELCVSSLNLVSYLRCCCQIENLLKALYFQFYLYQCKKNFMDGNQIKPKLKTIQKYQYVVNRFNSQQQQQN